jgi:methyltransferase (TIGR00027 family)
MEKTSMTELLSLYAISYHSLSNRVKIFDDHIAGRLLREEEKMRISSSLTRGIKFFDPSFSGTDEGALRHIIDNNLSPSPLGRAAFMEKALETSVMIGTRQLIILASGYDTFACRQPEWAKKLRIFELDRLCMTEDKKQRLAAAGIPRPENLFRISIDLTKDQIADKLNSHKAFDKYEPSFYCMPGTVYDLSKECFGNIIKSLSCLAPKGSSLVFDYPDENTYTSRAGDRAKKQVLMALGAGGSMLASYSYEEIEEMLSANGMLIYEHLTPDEITIQYFDEYNRSNSDRRMTAFDNMNYCLAVKQ